MINAAPCGVPLRRWWLFLWRWDRVALPVLSVSLPRRTLHHTASGDSLRRSFPATVLVATALTLIGTACGSVEPETGPAPVTEVTVPAAAAGVVEEIAAPVPWISVASSSLGQILVDGQGLTLYLVSSGVCDGSCAGIWPPVPYGDVAVLGDGIDAFLLGQTEREDGFVQTTYNGHPLYLYSGDSAPGDLNGQGVSDVWFVVDATGNGVGAAVEGNLYDEPPSDSDYDY